MQDQSPNGAYARSNLVAGFVSLLQGLWVVFKRTFRRPITVQYPEERPYLPPRWRGRIVLSRDPDGEERCVACYLCAAACPVDCIALQATEMPDEHDRRYPAWFRINFSRCIYCGHCEEACPTYAIQLIPDFEQGEYERHNMVYEKEDLLISGTGKYPDYNFYRVAGVRIGGKDKGEAENEQPPVDVRSLLP
jgi:NADH-quinone oxidoreductase subunit I